MRCLGPATSARVNPSSDRCGNERTSRACVLKIGLLRMPAALAEVLAVANGENMPRVYD